MFISRVEIPWSAVQNPYEIHRCLWRLFPGEMREFRQSREEERHGFLFRMEYYQTGRPARFLVQSRQRPMPVPSIQISGCREFHPQPQMDQRLAFLLTANPVKTIVDEEKVIKPDKRSNRRGQFKCRVPLIQEEDQRAWLVRQFAEVADIDAATILPHEPLYFRKGQRGGKLVTVTFEGILQVKSPDKLERLLENGIGPAKAFGCGLLLVRRT
jgi:CRISPR system Cascade subunit CasE